VFSFSISAHNFDRVDSVKGDLPGFLANILQLIQISDKIIKVFVTMKDDVYGQRSKGLKNELGENAYVDIRHDQEDSS
jgi:hypothetical protein